jgi:magnesium transporter
MAEEKIPLPIEEDEKKAKTTIKIITYNEKTFDEFEVKNIPELKKKNRITWIDITGLNDSEKIAEVCKKFGLHPLVIEDILTTRQRPKLDDYDDYLFLVIRVLSGSGESLDSDQLGIILGSDYVLTVREHPGPVFERVMDAIRRNKGRIRRQGADFLTYSLIDSVVDDYFSILERLGERISMMEARLIVSDQEDILEKIRKLKNEMLILRRSVWPLREVVLGLERESRNLKPLVSEDTAIYLRDVYDHTVQVMDGIESLREIVSGMLEIHLSSTSNRMNQIMKVLTIIGTIFIPLTFITGVYGMNFENMPETEHPLGYFAVLLLMFLISLGMLFYFRKKGWL